MPTLGVIADTHIPQRLASLPEGVSEAFRGVDLILHAGDLTDMRVLAELDRMAPTLAVRGNADLFNRSLPWRRTLEVGGKRLGLIHGHGSWLRYALRKWQDILMFPYRADVYAAGARAAFERDPVDAVVFGHTHRPCCKSIGGVLLFNPGSIAPDYYTTRGPQVGLLHVERDSLRTEFIEV